jgi:Heterokaryon incompatibility protein (HET)
MPSANMLEYQPLDADAQQFRLLRIKPRKSENIRCHIANFNIRNCPAYKTLSYTWEPKYPRRKIFVNGSRFEIGENLFQFLRHAWDQQEDYFWIDQLCIDQASITERNHQVMLMSEIYKGATETIIWLGVENGDVDKAMDFLKSLSSPVALTSPNMSAVPCRPLKMLFMRPYWTRLWIIQEIMLSRQILVACGSKTIRWETIRDFYTWCRKSSNVHISNFYSSNDLISPSVRAILNTKQQWGLGDQWKAPKHGLPNVLLTFSNAECHDFHDKVYGLLGLVTDSCSLRVDYSCSDKDLLRDILSEVKMNCNTTVNGAFQLGAAVARNIGFGFSTDRADLMVELVGQIFDVMPIDFY